MFSVVQILNVYNFHKHFFSRILDSFLCEGREVIFRLALILLSEAKSDLLQRDIEGVTKYFQFEMPEEFEANQDNIFTNAFNLNINQKMMKKIEKVGLTPWA